ncbi:hypothetical protein DXV75_00325 [Alteromonas aestuariivivens]|uniref:GlyGly-CTERM sorting domain-containing protein n=1 Tax=Alteromonas aestuariivivens TaxID=1938339 RepID=A0A3D8MEC3_9ALTE|nr:choice-of-anchor H family protein [Alteromonas aestuariivivens]RDV28950.1 hypothetical protein DXV75_00325 [Alteromonas aestuariivivens]
MKPSRSTRRLTWYLMVLIAGVSMHARGDTAKTLVHESQFSQPLPSSTNSSADFFRTPPALSQFQPRYRSDSASQDQVNFWIYDSWLNYFEDFDLDYDGYYSRFSVEFDADTVFARVPVYAVVYLGTHDRFEAIHVSSVFHIDGDDSRDSFVIDSTLVRGFPPRDYEVLIELYDAHTDAQLTSTDGYSDADLAFVSLESQNYDTPYTEGPVVIVEEYGGSLMWSSLLILGGLAMWRRSHRQKSGR